MITFWRILCPKSSIKIFIPARFRFLQFCKHVHSSGPIICVHTQSRVTRACIAWILTWLTSRLFLSQARQTKTQHAEKRHAELVFALACTHSVDLEASHSFLPPRAQQPKSQHAEGQGAAAPEKGTGTGTGTAKLDAVDLRERNFWVRDCLHDPR
jgi:hypothetical protein